MSRPTGLAFALTLWVTLGCVVAACGGSGAGSSTATSTTPPVASSTAAAPLSSQTVATPRTPRTIRSFDLASDANVQQLVRETGGEFVPGEVIYADLTGDGDDEAIVPIDSGGTAGTIAYIVLTGGPDGTIALLRHLPNPDVPGVSVRVEGRKLIETMPVYGQDDPNCCPSKLRVTEYRWDGTTLGQDSMRIIDNPAGGPKPTSPPG